MRGEDDEAVEIAVPQSVRARAEEIATLSRRLGDRGGGFTCAREVLAPALIYGLAHMRERYAQAALRDASGGRSAAARGPGPPRDGAPGAPRLTRAEAVPSGAAGSALRLARGEQVLEGEERG